MRVFPAARFSMGFALSLACLALTSCSTPKSPSTDVIPDTSFWKPQLLYIRDSPYRRLLVEVDAVEGCQPTDATLKKLREFLAAHCKKPDGIEIVRGSVIPRGSVRGLSAETIAARFVQGPQAKPPAEQPAFMQILCYDSDLLDKPGVADNGHGSSLLLRGWHRTPRNPQTECLPYPAVVVMNTRYYLDCFLKKAATDMMLHEAGHLLGLVSRTNNASGHHCADRHCLMYPTLNAVFHISRFYLGPGAITMEHPKLCQRCLAELVDDAKQPPPTNLQFVGPVLVRAERGYHVLSLPARTGVLIGGMTREDCLDFVAGVHAGTLLPGDDDATMNIKDAALKQPDKLSEILRRAGADPCVPVRRVVAEVCSKLHQFTNALCVCRQSVLMDATDDWIYNKLAWLEATCPDAHVRNGRDAIKNATKACELTDWRNCGWIDTLAAACAETGDFERAVKWEKQALRLASPKTLVQNEMRDRLSLYKQSKPFRDTQ